VNITVHHQPVNSAASYTLHAWEGSRVWNLTGTLAGGTLQFVLTGVDDPRQVQFKYYTTDASGGVDWEPDDYIRYIWQASPTDLWSFDFSARLLYTAPNPPGVVFAAGSVLTFNVVTQNAFAGGQLFAWDPYNPAGPSATFAQSGRAAPVSTFSVTLASWMAGGFHFKLIDPTGKYEPNSANRVWRPSDGNTLWLKSGQVSIRNSPLALTTAPVELLYATAAGPAPVLNVIDPVENLTVATAPTATAATANPLFMTATYDAQIYPLAMYNISFASGESSTTRPFPVDPMTPATPSCVVLGVGGCTAAFPPVAASVTVQIDPHGSASFAGGVSVQIGAGSATTAHQSVAANLSPAGMWTATLTVVQTVSNWVWLVPASGSEPAPYAWIDQRRYITPPTSAITYFTAAGVYGLTAEGKTTFADPPSRAALMQAAFGAAAGAGIFGAAEMPHGATAVGGDVYFVLHAPHAAGASLVWVNEPAAGPATRVLYSMSLTSDVMYWWCTLPAATAAAGERYHFLLNQNQEVMDPAAKQVQDRGDYETNVGDDPNDTSTSWSVLVDVAGLQSVARAATWQTMGWDTLLTYELHPSRFTDLSVGTLTSFDLVADELQPTSRLGQPGYLLSLGIMALQLMPVHEFKSAVSWGYNPAFFFAIDGSYGGCQALARLVNAAHVAGKAVLLDLVYNHMNDSPLTQIADDVYANGMDSWGDQINNAHPMVQEFFRQATVYLWQTFGLDGFRFDSTSSIIGNNGWQFLATIHSAVRAAASAEGKNAPYLVGENDPGYWNMTNPAWAVMDGQWDVAEVSDLGQAAYDPWQPADDHSATVAGDMKAPESWMRPFYEATRYGESHDTVSGQNAGEQRIAARPPYRMGLQMAKAVGTVALLSNGIPMIFMGQEFGDINEFSLDNNGPAINPQSVVSPPAAETDNMRVLAWFRSLIGLRNDPSKGFGGDANLQYVQTGRRTVAFTCGNNESHFTVVTFGTENQQQNSAWLGLPAGGAFKEIFNSSWPVFQVEFEQEQTNGGYTAQINSGQIINLPYIGAVVLERI
jgi:1,4-alpha-glucan branching enzyme